MKTLSRHMTNEIRRGAILVLVVITLPIIMIFAAYSVNVAQMQLVRTELRTATDAASRAGARKLSISQDRAAAEEMAIAAAGRNSVAGEPLQLRSSDLEFGMAEPPTVGARWEFVPAAGSSDPVNSLRVTGARTTGSASGAVMPIFSKYVNGGVFEPTKASTATQIDRDICLVLDRSGSMTNAVVTGQKIDSWSVGDPAPPGSKWMDLRLAVRAFLAALDATPQDEQVALATYSTNAAHELDLTLDYPTILDRLDVHTDNYRGGWTAVGDGASVGLNTVTDPNYARRYARKTIVLMTDGRHNRGQFPDTVAQEAHDNHGVIVHTVTFGDGANQALMKKTAAVGGGLHWHADTPESLVDAFTEIANNLPTIITE